MTLITRVFKKRRKVLIGYITVGYPDIEATPRIASVLAEKGCDIIELGIPFSDPLADGATIQKASFQSLQKGNTPEICFQVSEKIHNKISVPLVFMTYYNPVLNFGLEAFSKHCVKAGISGLIVPDLPPEEGKDLEKVTRLNNLDLIYLLAPTSTEERIAIVTKRSRGFIYLVSLTGVTGARNTLPLDLEEFVRRVGRYSRKPLCVGFGIATPEQASRVAKIADGVIIGSRLIQLVEEDRSLVSLGEFVSSLRQALDRIELSSEGIDM
jgi:tryptophan synthase alpha chain